MGIKEEVTAKILQALLAGTPPWRKGWSSGLARNLKTNRAYRGINLVILGMQEHDDERWMTYRQANEMGYQVRKGERSTKIVRLVEIEKRAKGAESEGEVIAEENNRRLLIRWHDVFNASQIDGIPERPARVQAIEPVEAADAIVEGMKQTGLKVIHGSTNAYYSLHVDLIRIPNKSSFHSTESYYSTMLHEISHSTGAPLRLNRDMGRPNSMERAREELRAEIASVMSLASISMPLALAQESFEMHASYVASWISLLKNDVNELFRAASDAQGICDYMQEHAIKIEPTTTSEVGVPSYPAAPSPRTAMRM